MRIAAGNSRWTNSSKGQAIHIQTSPGENLCKKKYKNGNLWSEELTADSLQQVTCQGCLAKYNNQIEGEYEVCEECEAVAYGNMFCNTCRTVNNKRFGLNLPPWNHPAEKPCGAEEIQEFINKLDTMQLSENEIAIRAVV